VDVDDGNAAAKAQAQPLSVGPKTTDVRKPNPDIDITAPARADSWPGRHPFRSTRANPARDFPTLPMNIASRCAASALVIGLGLLPAVIRSEESTLPVARRTTGGLKPPVEKEMIYVCVPGTLEASWDHNGTGIVVLNASDNYNFVKRIETWDIPASRWPEQVAGVAASPETNMIYVATRGRLGAWDLLTEKKVWENNYDGNCCERPQIAPDGSFMYVGSDLKDYWYVINPKNGDLMTKVVSPKSPNAHNLNLSPDGKIAFMAPNGKVMGIADTTTHQLLRTIEFPDNVRVFVVNHDASLIYTNLNNLLGFAIADVKTGKVLHRVEVQGFGFEEKWNVNPRPRVPHACPSHGIALVNNEKEVWVCDGLNNAVHVYDNTVMPPKYVQTIKTSHGPYWLTITCDGDRALCSSSDVIDIKTHKIVGQLKDELGRPLYSEKMLDMIYSNGKLVRVSNQFGNGLQSVAVPVAANP
jgi:DNA-binding beta-propeller fold protein YncE